MKESLLNRLTKCNVCGAMYILNYEGDDTTCDHCLAEQELISEDELFIPQVSDDRE